MKEEQKDKAEAEIGSALDQIEREGGDLDEWQRAQLAGALNSVFRGAYRLAKFQAALAVVPKAERSKAPIDLDPPIADMNLERFRKVLAEAQAEPAREFPHFGSWD
jgi:hypothetical protein